VYKAPYLNFTPPALSADYVQKRSNAQEIITEILVANLGDSNTKYPHLIVSAYGMEQL
jgi:cleavage and polyadenylation specificity factor subunit 1